MAKPGKSKAKLAAEALAIGMVKPHKKAASWCQKCEEYHSKGAHASHGRGSFQRTHGTSEERLHRDLAAHGAEELLLLADMPKSRRRG